MAPLSRPERVRRRSLEVGRDLAALVIAIGLATAVCSITFAVLYDAIAHPQDAGLSDNATQVLTAAFGGIIGILGTYVGFNSATNRSTAQEEKGQPDDLDRTNPGS
jgi:hypothetical protein